MATKVKAPAAAVEPGANDLQVLHPERTATFAGREVTVREYGFIEGLRLRPLLQPLLDALHAQAVSGVEIDLEGTLVLFGPHAERIQQLIATAADVEPEWVASLGHEEGYNLLCLWWEANRPFCWLSVRNRLLAELAVAAARAGQTSMPPSSPQATEAPATSAV